MTAVAVAPAGKAGSRLPHPHQVRSRPTPRSAATPAVLYVRARSGRSAAFPYACARHSLNAPRLVALVRAGAIFHTGKLIENDPPNSLGPKPPEKVMWQPARTPEVPQKGEQK